MVNTFKLRQHADEFRCTRLIVCLRFNKCIPSRILTKIFTKSVLFFLNIWVNVENELYWTICFGVRSLFYDAHTERSYSCFILFLYLLCFCLQCIQFTYFFLLFLIFSKCCSLFISFM